MSNFKANIEPLFTRGQPSSKEFEALRRRNAVLRILVVDDFLTMRTTIRALLRELGCINIDEAADGEMALQKIRANKYDLIVLDNQMPKLHGITLLERIRQSEDTQAVAVVMVTAEMDRSLVIKAAGLGINDFLIKPFSPASFTQRLTAVLSNLKRRKVIADPEATWADVGAAENSDAADLESQEESKKETTEEKEGVPA